MHDVFDYFGYVNFISNLIGKTC